MIDLFKHRIASFALFFVVMVMFTTASYADILLSPLKVVIEGRDRSGQVVLINSGDKTNTYNIAWEQYDQNPETGGYDFIDKAKTPGRIDLQDFAVFTPRKVTLEPGERQIIRVGIRRPADLADGEYKSHIKFTALPDETVEYQTMQEGNTAAAKVITSFSIPAVYRVGEYDSQVTIGDPSFGVQPTTGLLQLMVPLTHTGKHGVLGEFEIYYQSKGEEEKYLMSFQNVNIFPETSRKDVAIPLDSYGFDPGTLRIVYFKAEGDKNDYVKIAEKSIPVVN